MTIALPPRLAAVASLVLPGRTVADIGTDHAYLPIALLRSGRAPAAVATDSATGPLAAARRSVAAAGLADAVALRRGWGLEPLTPGEAGTIVIAGMGGYLIRDILAARMDLAAGAERLVLQPMRDAPALRRWLWANGWVLCAERLAQEDDRFYAALAVERRTADALRHESGEADGGLAASCDEELAVPYDEASSARLARRIGISVDLVVELGPLIIAGRDPLLAGLIAAELRSLAAIAAHLSQVARDGAPFDAAPAERPSGGSAAARRSAALARRRRELLILRAWLGQSETS